MAHQGLLVTAPHLHDRVVPPAVPGAGEAPEDLDRLDSLFAEPAYVEDRGGGEEIRVGQKGLHVDVHSRGYPAYSRQSGAALRFLKGDPDYESS